VPHLNKSLARSNKNPSQQGFLTGVVTIKYDGIGLTVSQGKGVINNCLKILNAIKLCQLNIMKSEM